MTSFIPRAIIKIEYIMSNSYHLIKVNTQSEFSKPKTIKK